MMFVNFSNIFWNFLAQVEWERNSGLNFFFFPFLGQSLPGLKRNNAGMMFVTFFQNFLARVEYERNSGLKRFPLFLSLSHPVLAKNNVGKSFYNFLNFFVIFFRIFLPGSTMNGIRD